MSPSTVTATKCTTHTHANDSQDRCSWLGTSWNGTNRGAGRGGRSLPSSAEPIVMCGLVRYCRLQCPEFRRPACCAGQGQAGGRKISSMTELCFPWSEKKIIIWTTGIYISSGGSISHFNLKFKFCETRRARIRFKLGLGVHGNKFQTAADNFRSLNYNCWKDLKFTWEIELERTVGEGSAGWRISWVSSCFSPCRWRCLNFYERSCAIKLDILMSDVGE